MPKLLPGGYEISTADLRCLANDLLDIDAWVNGAIAGKVAACKSRLLDEWYPRLLADPDVPVIPGDESALIALITRRPDYQNRSSREAAITHAEV